MRFHKVNDGLQEIFWQNGIVVEQEKIIAMGFPQPCVVASGESKVLGVLDKMDVGIVAFYFFGRLFFRGVIIDYNDFDIGIRQCLC